MPSAGRNTPLVRKTLYDGDDPAAARQYGDGWRRRYALRGHSNIQGLTDLGLLSQACQVT